MLKEASSFRDPSGVVILENERIIRRIYPPYFKEYHQLIKSGLYAELIEQKLIISHKEYGRQDYFIDIQPRIVPFISYPYEWCFSMLKEAALNTLKINTIALKHGMMLKDASAYNMQFYQDGMTLIDTLSFMSYKPGMPWGAYRQFLQHFLNPLLLMAYRDSSLSSLIGIEGIPSRLTASLLPGKLRWSIGTWAHLYAQSFNGNSAIREIKMQPLALQSLLSNLYNFISKLKYKPKSDWTKYGEGDSYTPAALEDKWNLVRLMVGEDSVCDFGANIGEFALGIKSILSIDRDHDCVEALYKLQTGRLPLVIDLCNPSPAIGFENAERKSFLDRLHVDTIMALALIHHICIGNNVPLERLAAMLSQHCKKLIIEFVPLEDPKAKLLLGKKNIPSYSEEIFKAEFGKYFTIQQSFQIKGSLRRLHYMEHR